MGENQNLTKHARKKRWPVLRQKLSTLNTPSSVNTLKLTENIIGDRHYVIISTPKPPKPSSSLASKALRDQFGQPLIGKFRYDL